jgi:hypothetical protein
MANNFSDRCEALQHAYAYASTGIGAHGWRQRRQRGTVRLASKRLVSSEPRSQARIGDAVQGWQRQSWGEERERERGRVWLQPPISTAASADRHRRIEWAQCRRVAHFFRFSLSLWFLYIQLPSSFPSPSHPSSAPSGHVAPSTCGCLPHHTRRFVRRTETHARVQI